MPALTNQRAPKLAGALASMVVVSIASAGSLIEAAIIATRADGADGKLTRPRIGRLITTTRTGTARLVHQLLAIRTILRIHITRMDPVVQDTTMLAMVGHPMDTIIKGTTMVAMVKHTMDTMVRDTERQTQQILLDNRANPPEAYQAFAQPHPRSSAIFPPVHSRYHAKHITLKLDQLNSTK